MVYGMYFRVNKKSDVEILSSSTVPKHTWSIILNKVRTSELRVGWEKCFITGYSLKKHWKSKANWVIWILIIAIIKKVIT